MSQPLRMVSTVASDASGSMIEFDMPAHEFREKLLEKNVHLFKGALRYREFSWANLDEVLNVMEPVYPVMQVFKEGLVPEEVYTEPALELGLQHRRLNKDRFAQLMRAGATVVLNRMESLSALARRLCMEVSRYAGHQTIGNGYLTLGGKGTFGKHWDTHDVFAVQLLGRKRWRVFPPTFPYPISTQTSQEVQNTAPATPVLDCVMETGDVLYIPRGWWHQVIPLEGESFHLSVGVYVPTMLEYVMWACQRYLPGEIAARKGMDGVQMTKDLAAVAQAVAAAVSNPSHAAEFIKSLAETQKPPAAIDLPLLLGIGSADIDGSTTITLNHSYPLDCTRNEIAVNGVAITLNDISRPVVKALIARTGLTLDALYEATHAIAREKVKALVLEFARMDVVSLKRNN